MSPDPPDVAARKEETRLRAIETKRAREQLEKTAEESLKKEIPILVADIHEESYRNSSSVNRPVTRTMAHFASLLGALWIRAEKQTNENLEIQRKVITLTNRLFWLSIVLGAVAVAQVFLSYLQLKATKVPNVPNNQADQHETDKTQQPLQTPVDRPTQH